MKIVKCTLGEDLNCQYRKNERCSIENLICCFSEESEDGKTKTDKPAREKKWFEKYYRNF